MKSLGIQATLTALAAVVAAASAIEFALSPAHAGSAQTILIEQPSEKSIGDRLLVPPATHVPLRAGSFDLVLWEPNPNREDGEMVPSGWTAGNKTGFSPSSSVGGKQVSMKTDGESTTAQMDGDTVGVYLNSDDLPMTTHKTKLMIAPSYQFERDRRPQPFSTTNSVLTTTLQLQVPTAIDQHRSGSETYIVGETVFISPKGCLVSYGVSLFFNGVPHSKVRTGFDSDTHSFMMNVPLGENEQYIHRVGPSAPKQSAPWSGWRNFDYALSYVAFAGALSSLKQQYGNSVDTTNPADYKLVGWHLNAELHFGSGPAELGWSMRHMKLTIASDQS